jgi:hypothetical protein
MIRSWSQIFPLVFSSYIILYYNVKDLAFVFLLSGMSFVFGFFYLLNFNGTDALKYLTAHAVLLIAIFWFGAIFGAMSAFKYGKMGWGYLFKAYKLVF